ncbi:putative F-box-like domain superfamily protein [Helianthus anomalus]
MSDNIPFQIQVEIIKKLRVKSLIQFRSVSKAWKSPVAEPERFSSRVIGQRTLLTPLWFRPWKSLIESSDFITHYNTQLQHLFVRYHDPLDDERKYVSIVDDDTFPHQRVSLTPPLLVNMFLFSNYTTVGSSNGLLCLDGYYGDAPFYGKRMSVLWNISIRKAVGVVLPNVTDNEIYRTILGFGVCWETTDPKVVKITHCFSRRHMETSIPDSIPWQVEVFTLSTGGTWRSP